MPAESTTRMLTFMARVLAEIGPRPSCGPAERRLADALEADLRPCCEQVSRQAFTCHPDAHLGLFPYLVGGYLVALAAYWLLPPVAALVACALVAAAWLQVFRGRELLDRFFPAAESANVVGLVRPTGEARRRVIVSAHLDSAWEFNLWTFLGNASVPLMGVAAFALLWLAGGSLAWAAAWAFGAGMGPVFSVVGHVAALLYPVVGLFAFFHTRVPVPGAFDDLAGIAVVRATGLWVGGSRLAHTEVLLVGFGAEEAGLRGSKRFVEANRERLRALPTWVVNLDGIADERHLTVLEREYSGGARHDPRLVGLARQVAAEAGLPMKVGRIPIGATDAAPFSGMGVPATTLLCQETGRLPPYYHTRRDTLEIVRPEALEAAFAVVRGMVLRIDAGALDG